MTSKYKLKLVCGYREDQEFTIDANESHRAYYLFQNPTERGVFANGIAIIGSDIKRIVPNYQATMGWNPGYRMTAEDWAEVHKTGLEEKFRDIMEAARQVAQNGHSEDLQQPLIELVKGKYQQLYRPNRIALHD